MRLLHFEDTRQDLITNLIETIYNMPLLEDDNQIEHYICRSIENKYIYLSKKLNYKRSCF